jgi:DNA-binding MarR family transcriptional regulator
VTPETRRRPRAPSAAQDPLSRQNLGFLLAKAAQRWNELLGERFAARGFPEVRPSYGSILVPLFEEDRLRMGELSRRARLSKQTMTTMVRLLERDGLVRRVGDPDDGRAYRVHLTPRAREVKPVAREVLMELDAQVQERLTARQRAALGSGLAEILQL